ncbi:MAG: iron-sulfur cluster assembly scaffold protein [Thermodesulfobacteriota bacterium]
MWRGSALTVLDTMESLSFDHHSDDIPANLDKRFFAHAEYPRNLGRIDGADGQATGKGVCGDSMDIYLCIRGEKIHRVGQIPHGCLYTVASASAVSDLCLGKRLDEALRITPEDVAGVLGGLPEDHMHCARLAVNTLGEAIEDYYRKIWAKTGGK